MTGPTMRLLLTWLALAALLPAMPAELARALEHFRADPPPGWSYTQTTTGEGRRTVERHDASQPEFGRWSLVETDGHPPSPEEAAAYRERRGRRSRAIAPPQITEQLDLSSIETAGDGEAQAVFRARLRPGETGDTTARALRVTITVHRPSGTIASIELANDAPFSPALGVRITEMRTRLTFTAPSPGRPLLPDKVSTRVRGRAFLFKSLDADLLVCFEQFERARR